MKKSISFSFLLFSLLFFSCGENVEKSAERFLTAAQTAFDAGRYDEAKAQIDSIKVVYPKAFEARKAGIALLRQVELAEAHRNYAYTDSLLTISRARVEEIVGGEDGKTQRFTFEKDPQYQDIGLYYSPSQQLVRNAQRCYLRGIVDEHGRMTLTSFWRGAKYIHHHAVKVSAGGTFAQTATMDNTYESSDALAKTERNDFILGESDGGVIAWMALHAGEAVKVEYLGDTNWATTLTAADTRAIADVYELAQALQTVRKLSVMQDETTRRIAFLEKNEARAAKE
jgi:energy-converting hydrogenase Eha subunit B